MGCLQASPSLEPNTGTDPFFACRLEKRFCVSFVLIHFKIGELLSKVGGHALILAWFDSSLLCLVFLDSSLQSPGQEKHFPLYKHIILPSNL